MSAPPKVDPNPEVDADAEPLPVDPSVAVEMDLVEMDLLLLFVLVMVVFLAGLLLRGRIAAYPKEAAWSCDGDDKVAVVE